MASYERIPCGAVRRPDDYYYDHDSYWCRRSHELFDAIRANPSNRQLKKDLAHVEKERERAHECAYQRWSRDQEREEADRWLEEMAGAPGFELY